MTPFFFGPGGALFGAYHPPEQGRRRGTAVVLCYPAGHEYLRVQRSFRNLAAALARIGIPVLRFDYFGTGDSAGGGEEATLDRWQRDLGCAIDEVRRRSGAATVALAGLRLGATLAWQATLTRPDVSLLIAWEPVLKGGEYLHALREVERSWLSVPVRGAAPAAEIAAGLLLGFPVGPAMEQQLMSLDLTSGPVPQAARVFALMASEDPKEAAWRERVRAIHGPNSCGVMPGGASWDDPEAIHTAVYPQLALQSMTAVFDQLAL